MSQVSVRPGSPEDLPAVAGYHGEGEGPLDQFAGIERLRRLPLDGLLVAELDLDVIGFLYWFRHRRPFFDPEVEEYASIQELHVFEGFRELFRDVHYKLRL